MGCDEFYYADAALARTEDKAARRHGGRHDARSLGGGRRVRLGKGDGRRAGVAAVYVDDRADGKGRAGVVFDPRPDRPSEVHLKTARVGVEGRSLQSGIVEDPSGGGGRVARAREIDVVGDDQGAVHGRGLSGSGN